jgi:hypothetical protein
MAKITLSRCCSLRSLRRRPLRIGHLMLAALVLLAFLAGLVVGELRGRRNRGSDDMEFLRRLAKAADVGIISVDRKRLDELICIVSEAEWEDRQAEPHKGP